MTTNIGQVKHSCCLQFVSITIISWCCETQFLFLDLNCTELLAKKPAVVQTKHITPNKEAVLNETKCQEKGYQIEFQKKFQSITFGKFVLKQGALIGDSMKYTILFVAEKHSPVTLSLDNMMEKTQPYLPFKTSSEKDMSKGFLKHYYKSFQVLEHVVEISASSWMQNVKIKGSGLGHLRLSKLFDKAVEQYGSLNFGQ